MSQPSQRERDSIWPCVLLMLGFTGWPDAASAEPLEKLASGYRFTEGPAASPDGAVYFTDIPNKMVLRFDPVTGETTTVYEDTGGANGLAFDAAGRLIACEGVARRVARFNPDGTTTPLTIAYDDQPLNKPNDLVIDESGGIYFTDPRYGDHPDMSLPEAVYYRAPDGKLTQIIADLVRPNGIALSPDQRVLYVADNADNAIYAYDVAAPGIVNNKRPFGDLPEPGGPDGMSVDNAGNLYVAQHPGNVFRFAPEGFANGTITTPGRVTNCVATERWLYITAQDPQSDSWGLWRISIDAIE